MELPRATSPKQRRQDMKKKEIEAIIKDNPTAVFALNGNYIQYVVITGFKQVSRTKYATPTTYATGFRVWVREDQDYNVTIAISDMQSQMTLTQISHMMTENTAHFTTIMQTKTNNARANQIRKNARKTEAEQAVAQLKELGFSSEVTSDYYGTTYRITLSTENMQQIIELLSTHAASI
jgi:iron-sulfur cluster repair protein YtfE (RIC family)